MNRVTVLGAGYVGLTTAATINRDLDITVYDVDTRKIDALNNANCPIAEPGMHTALFNRAKQIAFLPLVEGDFSWVKDTDLIIIAVGTPTLKGSQQADTTVIDSLLAGIAENSIEVPVIIKSTIPILYCNQKSKETGLQIMHIPEFLRQGYAIQDAQAERVIVGRSGNIPTDRAKEIGELLFCKDDITVVPNRTAALAKLARNTYLALHISYANELNQLCKAADIDYDSLKILMDYDDRIHTTYMEPSPGFGGSCLPKDTRSIAYQYHELINTWLPTSNKQRGLLDGIVESNVLSLGCAYTWVKSIIQRHIEEGVTSIGVLGLTFKQKTDDLRESRYYDIASSLADDADLASIKVNAFDAAVSTVANEHINIQSDPDIVADNDILIINHANFWDRLDDIQAKVLIDFTTGPKTSEAIELITRKEYHKWKA